MLGNALCFIRFQLHFVGNNNSSYSTHNSNNNKRGGNGNSHFIFAPRLLCVLAAGVNNTCANFIYSFYLHAM